MNNIEDHLKDISEIRTMMERSTKFLSLSGLSGICAGICALIGAWFAWDHLDGGQGFSEGRPVGDLRFLLLDAAAVLISALAFSSILSYRMAKKKGLAVWNKTAMHMAISLLIPLTAGGILGLIMIFYGEYQWVASITLLFYGLALLNAGKYTLNEIKALGVIQIIIGLFCAAFYGYGLYFWALGFGIMHIVYGSVMYFKYER